MCSALCLLLFKRNTSNTELTFSKESGFYKEPFLLELHAPIGTEIYYTLDGSDPTENAIKYTEPIVINNATANANVNSMRTDVSAGFLTDTLALYGLYSPPPHYKIPDYLVDKCTIVKSAYRDSDGNFGPIQSASYFIDYANKSGYEGLNIISIIMEPSHLFDYDTGIYVLGRVYDDFNKADRTSTWKNSYWQWWPANYHQHGFEWERPASIQLFDADRNLFLNDQCGVRIQGGGSRGQLPKSLNLYAREQYNNTGRFYFDLFGTDYMADTITLFAGGDDSISKLRDALVSGLVSDRNFSTMNYEPYAMFLNGEYWGFYWLTEKYDAVYLKDCYDIEKENLLMVKNLYASEGEEHYELFSQMINYMSNTDLSINENYQYACELIDMQSYIDYYATEIYIARQGDWPGTNEALWRTIEPGNEKYEDAKWRWMLFDVNSDALTTDLISADTFSYVMYKNDIFNNLCQNSEFKKQFTTTFMDLVNTSFSREHVDSTIADYVRFMEKPMELHHKRFFGVKDNQKFLNEVSDIRNFFDHRKPYIVQHLKENFGLVGNPTPVELEINNPKAGSVILNTIEPTFNAEGKWQGEYYTDYPITLTAIANNGYHFVRWENAISSSSENIEVSISPDGVCIRAVFEKNKTG